jgi:5-bromo-4-chloroindolyl phosphate hydrolysis protein
MAENSLSRVKKLVPLGVGVLVAGVAYLVFSGIIFPAIGFVAGWVVTQVVMFPKPGSPTMRRIGPGSDSARAIEGSGVDAADLEKTLREAKSKQMQMQNEAFRITKPEIRKLVDGIADATGRIIDEVRRDPKDLRNAYQFFGYYLDASLKIVKRYVELAATPNPAEDVSAACARVEGELSTIKDAFEKQLVLLRENDMIDLDVELTVLKKTIEMEGLGK